MNVRDLHLYHRSESEDMRTAIQMSIVDNAYQGMYRRTWRMQTEGRTCVASGVEEMPLSPFFSLSPSLRTVTYAWLGARKQKRLDGM